MIIRKATIKDAESLANLDKIAYREIKGWALQSKRNFEKTLGNKKFYFLMSLEKNRDIAYLESEYDKEKDAVWLKNIYVMKEFRKKNIAKHLIKKCSNYWRKKTNIIILLTADRNFKIFEKLGFNKTMNYMVKIIK